MNRFTVREPPTIQSAFVAMKSCTPFGRCFWTPSFGKRMKRDSSGSAGIRFCAAYSPASSFIQRTTPRSESYSLNLLKKLTLAAEFSSHAFVISHSVPARAATSRRRTCASWELYAT